MRGSVLTGLLWVIATITLAVFGLFLYEQAGPEAWQIGGEGFRSITGLTVVGALAYLIYRSKSLSRWFPLFLMVLVASAYCLDPWYAVPFHSPMPMTVIGRWVEYGVISGDWGYIVTNDAGLIRAYQIGPGPASPKFTPVRMEEIPETSNVKAIYLQSPSIRTRLELWRLGYPGYPTLGQAALRIPPMYRHY